MLTAQLLGRVEFSSLTEIPKTATTPETSIFEFIVHSKSKFLKDPRITCRIDGKRAQGLLDHVFIGVGIFVDGSLEVIPFIDEQTGTARAETILHVDRLFITSVPNFAQNA